MALAGPAMAASPIPSTTATTTYHRTEVDGVGIFYREAGPKDAPTIVLLHGFPSSSRGYSTLIPLLATRYHVYCGPDLRQLAALIQAAKDSSPVLKLATRSCAPRT
jgi:alpha-beta hydrolase superfamily lysophospholipase